MLTLILLVVAFVCFLLSALQFTSPRVNLADMGRALLVLAYIAHAYPNLVH